MSVQRFFATLALKSVQSFALFGSVSLMILAAGCDSGPRKATVSGNSDSVATSLSSSGGSSSEGSGSKAVSNMAGTVQIEGSSTVQPISDAIAEEFKKTYPNVTINVGGDGTGSGFRGLYEKKADIADASRPVKPGEFQKCQDADVAFIEVPVAYDGLTICVNPKNDWVDQLTIDQLKTMFVGDDAAKTWKDVDSSWPDEPIDFYSPGTGSGTYDYFHEVTAKKDKKELRGDMSLNENDNILVNGVAGNKNAIGYFGVAYFEQNKDKLKAVKIVNPDDGKPYLPTIDNIAGNKYAPFSRPLFIYVSTASLGRAEVQTFVNFYMENASELAQKVGYVRLPDSILQRGIENLDSEVVGTHFVDSEGNGREGTFTEVFSPENIVK